MITRSVSRKLSTSGTSCRMRSVTREPFSDRTDFWSKLRITEFSVRFTVSGSWLSERDAYCGRKRVGERGGGAGTARHAPCIARKRQKEAITAPALTAACNNSRNQPRVRPRPTPGHDPKRTHTRSIGIRHPPPSSPSRAASANSSLITGTKASGTGDRSYTSGFSRSIAVISSKNATRVTCRGPTHSVSISAPAPCTPSRYEPNV